MTNSPNDPVTVGEIMNDMWGPETIRAAIIRGGELAVQTALDKQLEDPSSESNQELLAASQNLALIRQQYGD